MPLEFCRSLYELVIAPEAQGLATPATVVEWQMRAWWSMLLLPNMETILRNICACSLLCFDEPIQNTASGPLSLRIASSLSPISLIAWSHEMRRYLPSISFIGYLRRCECSVMPCSRMLAPLAQCAPMLSGESNTGSWRTHTPSWTTASIEQPTEQCVQMVRFTSSFPVAPGAALASPIRLSGSWLANAAAPTATPEPLRNVRRSTERADIADIARASGLRLWAGLSDVFVSNMAAASGFRGLVVLQDVLGSAITVGLLRGQCRFACDLGLGFAQGRHGGDRPGAAQSGGEQEIAAGCRFRFHITPPFAKTR